MGGLPFFQFELTFTLPVTFITLFLRWVFYSYCMVLADTPRGAGMPMAENLLRHLAQARFVRPESNIAPTITSETLRDSFEDADAALALIRRKALVPPAARGPSKWYLVPARVVRGHFLGFSNR